MVAGKQSCVAELALSEITRVRGLGYMALYTYYTQKSSLPSPFEANTTELVSCNKWRWEQGHKRSKPQHWSAPLWTGTCSSAERYCTRAGLLREQGTIVPSSAHKKYYLFWCSQPQQQPFFLGTALEKQNLKAGSPRQSCTLCLLKADSSGSLCSGHCKETTHTDKVRPAHRPARHEQDCYCLQTTALVWHTKD